MIGGDFGAGEKSNFYHLAKNDYHVFRMPQ